LFVDVTPLASGERFRVVTTDAEDEVRGTAFDVSADHGHLRAVHVWHGKVEVRPLRGPAVLLGAGQSWTSPPATPNVASAAVTAGATAASVAPTSKISVTYAASSTKAIDRASERKVLPNVRLSTLAEPAVVDRVVDPGVLVYQEALSALRAGDHAGAAKGFERAATIAPHSPLAEDAWYWRAVSLARSNQSAAARAAFAAFLEHYRSSPRAMQASAMLGWLLFDAGDLAGAELRFQAAAGDTAGPVRDSANQGLDAVRERRRE
jgi:TolA-binding protein